MKSSDSEKSRQRKRKSVQHAEIITQSPYKKKLEESIANAAKGLEQKESREKKGEKRRVAQAKVTVENKSKQKKTKENATRKGTRKAKKPKQTKNKSSSGDHCNTTRCLVCAESNDEDWIQCNNCHSWVHEACANIQHTLYYYCDNCISNSQ